MSGHFVLATPNHQLNQSTFHGKTLPDISLGSVAASFDAEQQEEMDLQRQNGDGQEGPGGNARQGSVGAYIPFHLSVSSYENPS